MGTTTKKLNCVYLSMKKWWTSCEFFEYSDFYVLDVKPMPWCEVASILVTGREAWGLQQTVWRCKCRAMLAWLCCLRDFTPECERAWGRQNLVCQKTPYSACPSLSCACLQHACQNVDSLWWRGFKWVVALTVINGLVHRIWICTHKNYKPRLLYLHNGADDKYKFKFNT